MTTTTAQAAKASPARSWSPQQSAIFDWFRSGAGNLIVRARAGTGKTTTILEGVQRAPERKILLAAFNKSIATELQAKLGQGGAEAKTLHGVGFRFVAKAWQGVQIDGNRAWKIAAQLVGEQEDEEIIGAVAKLATLSQEVLPFDPTRDQMVRLAEAFDLTLDADFEDKGWTDERIASLALVLRDRKAQQDGTIDFADMLWLPLRHGWAKGWWDMVCVDEAQDMNAAQLELAMRCVRRGGRICVIGDDRQAIYQFRGADSGGLERMRASLKAGELGLTTTYRCPRTIVAEAAKIVPDYAAAPGAPDGVIDSLDESKLVEVAQPGDFVLSRTNADLARVCLGLLRAGVRARIQGRDIGIGLQKIIAKLAVGCPDVETLIERLVAWRDREMARAERAEKQAKAALVEDQGNTLIEICSDLDTIAEVAPRIDRLFAPTGGPAVVCSTVHRAKGLEAPRVFILGWTLYFGKPRTSRGDFPIEESNLEYVAITRAQQRLTWVTRSKS